MIFLSPDYCIITSLFVLFSFLCVFAVFVFLYLNFTIRGQIKCAEVEGTSLGFLDDSLKPINIYYFDPPHPEDSKTEFTETHQNMTCGELGIDEACLLITPNIDKKVKLLYASMECDKCLLQEWKTIRPSTVEKVVIKFASLGSVWEIVDEENKSLCSRAERYLGEGSRYHIYVNDTGCSVVCDKEAEFQYYPIIIAVAVYLLFAVMWILGKYIKRKEVFNNLLRSNSLDVSTDLAAAFSSSSSADDSKKKPSQKRLKSLDTVRGIAIVIMIFVNYGGGKYWFLHHTRWNGLTIADLVFPWFIWMMGMSMALSLRSLLRKAVPRKKIFYKIIKRSIILFALGIMLNTYCQEVNLKNLRILGVLQRFSISYFIVASIHLFYASAQEDQASSSAFRDITPYGVEWLIMCTLLIAHILLTFLIHSSDCPLGYLGPGGNHDGGKYSLCTGGAAGYIDREFLGRSHLYQHPSFKEIYHTSVPYDPEGILGYLTSIFLVFLGLQAGKILLSYKDSKGRLLRWMFWSCLTGVIAAVLCLGSKNNGYIPVNKNLWSVSFILATGSMAFALMSVCYFVIDVKKWWNGAPFFYAGMNSIMLYVGHEITHKMFPWNWEMEPSHMTELFQDLWGTTLWVLISIYMYYKKFFLAI